MVTTLKYFPFVWNFMQDFRYLQNEEQTLKHILDLSESRLSAALSQMLFLRSPEPSLGYKSPISVSVLSQLCQDEPFISL